MAQHVICRSLSSGRGGGGAAFHTRWGWAAASPPAPPKAMLDPGLVTTETSDRYYRYHTCRMLVEKHDNNLPDEAEMGFLGAN